MLTGYDENMGVNEQLPEPKRRTWKLWLIAFVIFTGIIVIIIRLFFIQVLDSEQYIGYAKKQHESRVYLHAERGNIYDRNGELLVANIKKISIAVDPTYFKSKDEGLREERVKLKLNLCKIISEITGESVEYYVHKINNSSSSFLWLARGIEPEKIKKLRNKKIKGLLYIEEPRRLKAFGNTGIQLIGTTDIDNNGLGGIEKSMDSILKGSGGYMIMYRDALGNLHPSANLPIFEPMNGNSIKLTIDVGLQQIIEYELKQGIKNFKAESGTAAAIDPITGEILAMASYTMDSVKNVSSKMQDVTTVKTRLHANRNIAITDVYEPGSTFKLITAAAALEEGLTDLKEKFNGYGGLLKIDDYEIKDEHPLSEAVLTDALQYSSNIVMSQIANRIPGKIFYKYIKSFGFGQPAGTGLPGEASGRVPSPDKFNTTAKRFIGFGYGISASALQILNTYSIVANNGLLIKPFIVKEIYNDDGDVIYNAKPEIIRRVLKKQTSAELKKMLISVIERGTGTKARIIGLKIAGKTGTAQQIKAGEYSEGSYNASFVGFFPADKPKIAMIIILDKPQSFYYGGLSAAPVFRNVVMRWINVHPEIINGK